MNYNHISFHAVPRSFRAIKTQELFYYMLFTNKGAFLCQVLLCLILVAYNMRKCEAFRMHTKKRHVMKRGLQLRQWKTRQINAFVPEFSSKF